MSSYTRNFVIIAMAAIAVGVLLLAPRLFRTWVDWREIDGATGWAIREGVSAAAAIERYHAEKGAYPGDLQRDLIPEYTSALTVGWHLNHEDSVTRLMRHSNLPEWLLQYDFESKRWTVDTVGKLVDISNEVTSASPSP